MRRIKLSPKQARKLQARYADMAMRLEIDRVNFQSHIGFSTEVLANIQDAHVALKTASQNLAAYDLGSTP